jgi:hypothetical protein
MILLFVLTMSSGRRIRTDQSFGKGGRVVTPGGGLSGSVSASLAIQLDGRIVVAGTGFDPAVN